jgi:hypothetical protein
LHSETGRYARRLVDVDLDNLESAGEFVGGALDTWRDYPARTTPWPPQIEQYRYPSSDRVGELGFIDVD